MKNTILKTTAVFVVLLLSSTALFLTACATRISLRVERTPVLNTAGINRIAVMPFQVAVNDAIYNEMATYTTNTVTSKFRGMSRFTVVDSNTIRQLERSNQSIEGHVDALFRGQISRVNHKDSSQLIRQVDSKTGKDTSYTNYTREVDIEFNYYIARARDGTIIGPITKKRSSSTSSRERGSLPSVSSMLTRIVDSELRNFNQEVTPYIAIENRAIAKDPSKDKVLQARMKDTLAQVKAGSYRVALESYLAIYGQYKSIAAAENASILYEALGETQTAANFMQQAYNETGNPTALSVLSRLNRILQDQATIASDYGDERNQTEKIAAYASGEIQKVLPRGARVWIYNNAGSNTMVQAVVDNITSSFITSGISVVDRENSAIMDAEQNFQLSGNVRDDDFISVGNAAGANTIVVIGITGTGDMRRLQIRVLDLESRAPLFQSDTSDGWKI